MALSFNLTAMLTSLNSTIPAFMQMVAGAAYVMGISFTASAIYHMKVYGEARTMMATQTGLKQPVTYIFVAAMLFYLPTSVNSVMLTTFGYDNPLAYGEWSGGSVGLATMVFLQIIRLIGLIAFVKGWVLLARSSQQGAQPGQFGKAMVHILGGIFAINIVGTTNMLANTLGITL